MGSPSSSLSADQLEDLQAFLKDWLRHAGRTQSDLRRALRATSIRMPVLIEELERTYRDQGLSGLAQRLCGIEAQWHVENGHPQETMRSAVVSSASSLGQLDLLLDEIRQEGAS